MSRGFQEYVELFEYFGRGGAVRLNREQFEVLDREFQGLVGELEAIAAGSSTGGTPDEQRARKRRLALLKQLLLRDRP